MFVYVLIVCLFVLVGALIYEVGKLKEDIHELEVEVTHLKLEHRGDMKATAATLTKFVNIIDDWFTKVTNSMKANLYVDADKENLRDCAKPVIDQVNDLESMDDTNIDKQNGPES